MFELSQWLHLIGAVLGALGYVAIYNIVRRVGAVLASIAILTGVCGMILFAADAVLALVLFPVLADVAPNMLAPNGAMFTGRVLSFYISTYVIHMSGILLLCLTMIKTRQVSFLAIGVFGLGGVVMNFPPIPGLHILAVAGGITFGLGAAWVGWQLILIDLEECKTIDRASKFN